MDGSVIGNAPFLCKKIIIIKYNQITRLKDAQQGSRLWKVLLIVEWYNLIEK